jgi:hypothetical protein
MTMNDKRLKCARFSLLALTDIIRGGRLHVSNLPDDVKVEHIEMNTDGLYPYTEVLVYFESDSFKMLGQGEEAPALEVMFSEVEPRDAERCINERITSPEGLYREPVPDTNVTEPKPFVVFEGDNVA